MVNYNGKTLNLVQDGSSVRWAFTDEEGTEYSQLFPTAFWAVRALNRNAVRWIAADPKE